jgi:hypothetical protein
MTLQPRELLDVEYLSGVNMGQEFFIKSEDLEAKVRELLPSQGGLGAGFDLTGSTQIVPIVDLTEAAEGSTLRQDLQTAFSHNSITSTIINNATRTTIVNNTGYFRVFGSAGVTASSATTFCRIELYDGATYKTLFEPRTIQVTATGNTPISLFDFVVKIGAGESITGTANTTSANLNVATRQIADIAGTLVNP